MPVRLYTFGRFRVDIGRRLLLRDGAAVPLTPKGFDILALLLRRRNEVIEKDDILTEVWRGTIVEENNLARHISTLRKTLDDAPGQNRYIVTIPGRGYQFVGDVQEFDTADQTVSSAPGEFASAEPATRPRARLTRSSLAIAAVLAAFVFAILAYASRRPQLVAEPSVESQIWQLTFASGLQGEPTWSPDGRMVAFSSGSSGNLDIWVQAIIGGNPVQVTTSPTHDWQPDWSTDGRLVFRSERNGGGLYVMSALGGEERQVSTFGYRPRWSPDGSQILFQRSNLQGRVVTAREVYVVSLDGRPPRQILPAFFAHFGTFTTGWHPDSKRVSVWGSHVNEGLTFWTAALDGSPAVESVVADTVRQRLSESAVRFTDADNAPLPFLWSRSGDALYFEGSSHGVRNVWKVGVNESTLEWRRGPERLTTSADLNEGIALSHDGTKLAFGVRDERIRLWSFPMDTTSGRLTGGGDPITGDTVDALTPVLSRDGTRLVFGMERGGKQELWQQSLADSRETLLVAGDKYRRVSPVWAHDNGRIMYLRTTRGGDGETAERQVVTIPASGGTEQALRTRAPLARLFDWSADGAWILAAVQQKTSHGYDLAMVRADGTGPADVRVLASDPQSDLFKARLSGDQKWVASVGVTGRGVSAIYAVPAGGGDRVDITSGQHFDDRPRWSPDGRVIYFLSNRSGFLNVWGRRFDPERRQGVGEPFPVTGFDSPARVIPPRMVQLGVAISRDRLILPVSEASGNVWILDTMER